ncbi:hypothetical protein [Bordetella sp. LUAb4]|uniref:hypothetical protein n=1 Tax=Bordetella sp. LUAb4 TaxID=2843195 RepID=UPI001E48F944|nr:hypothetical protein [Bordetella sp. LUAb4]
MVLRVALRQSDNGEFFALSLVVAGIGLYVALTTTPVSAYPAGGIEEPSKARRHPSTEARHARTVALASFSVWASVIGAVWWFYLLAASLSEEVRDAFPYYPLSSAIAYYFFGILLTEWKAKGEK